MVEYRQQAHRGWGKPAQAVAITGDPDSPVIFHLRLGDGLAPKVIEHEPAPEALLVVDDGFEGGLRAKSARKWLVLRPRYLRQDRQC